MCWIWLNLLSNTRNMYSDGMPITNLTPATFKKLVTSKDLPRVFSQEL
jgi:hypothetical protein